MLRQLSNAQTSGRVSGLGYGLGYFGSVVTLLVVYFGFINGDGADRGLAWSTRPPTARTFGRRCCSRRSGSAAVRAARAHQGAQPKPDALERREVVGFFAGYRRLWTEIVSEWRRDHNIIYYLVASAVFRDGLAGVFTFGAVLGVGVYGISQADVLLFGVCASVVAAIGAVIGGLLDDRFGAKPVIVGSLTGDDRGRNRLAERCPGR